MTKQEILKLFERNKGEIISGEELAKQLGLTRTAVWKAINTLREEGYDIESVRKKGYRLNVNSDILSVIKIRDHLMQDIQQIPLEIHKSIDSTNKRLKVLAIEGAPAWTVVASEEQSHGKGREQRAFASPEGKGVYMSLLIRPEISWTQKNELLQRIRECVREVLEQWSGQQVEVSEKGDLSIQNKKIAGILTEISVEAESEKVESVVVGIGINIYDQRPEQSEDQIEASLSDIVGGYCNRSEIIASLINQIYQAI